MPKLAISIGLWIALVNPAPAFAVLDIEEDPSCVDVNYAYVATRSSKFYSEKLYDFRSDGSVKQIAEMRIDDETIYHRELRKAKWRRFDRTEWSTLDRFGPRFSSCEFLGEFKERGKMVKRYKATWHLFPYAAYSDIWILSAGKRLLKLKRRSVDSNQFKFGTTSGTVLELFDYDPTTGVAPNGPFED
ncbi:hypothetical protein [Rhizobium sp. BK251]|uniref:hypothetical protein n=1 Tax=Rhizobium sp. BK251 TaxID=2512125 RepID=UPI0010528F30|nr:hypothetical protein [Rhizobium sp. BK251]TCL73940.1 hypothetical protein EV286_103474 [Rhizobium sp. BK251]